MANLFSSGALQFFPSSAVILLVVWCANSNCSAGSKDNLLNDNTYRCDSVIIIMSSFGNKETLDLFNEESVSGARSCKASL